MGKIDTNKYVFAVQEMDAETAAAVASLLLLQEGREQQRAVTPPNRPATPGTPLQDEAPTLRSPSPVVEEPVFPPTLRSPSPQSDGPGLELNPTAAVFPDSDSDSPYFSETNFTESDSPSPPHSPFPQRPPSPPGTPPPLNTMESSKYLHFTKTSYTGGYSDIFYQFYTRPV